MVGEKRIFPNGAHKSSMPRRRYRRSGIAIRNSNRFQSIRKSLLWNCLRWAAMTRRTQYPRRPLLFPVYEFGFQRYFCKRTTTNLDVNINATTRFCFVLHWFYCFFILHKNASSSSTKNLDRTPPEKEFRHLIRIFKLKIEIRNFYMYILHIDRNCKNCTVKIDKIAI